MAQSVTKQSGCQINESVGDVLHGVIEVNICPMAGDEGVGDGKTGTSFLSSAVLSLPRKLSHSPGRYFGSHGPPLPPDLPIFVSPIREYGAQDGVGDGRRSGWQSLWEQRLHDQRMRRCELADHGLRMQEQQSLHHAVHDATFFPPPISSSIRNFSPFLTATCDPRLLISLIGINALYNSNQISFSGLNHASSCHEEDLYRVRHALPLR